MLVLTTALACICPCPPLPSCNMQHAACTAAQQHATTPLLLMCALHWQATRWGRCSRAPRRPAGRRLQRRARQRGRGAARPPFLADAPPAAPSSTYALPHGIAAPPHPAHGAAGGRRAGGGTGTSMACASPPPAVPVEGCAAPGPEAAQEDSSSCSSSSSIKIGQSAAEPPCARSPSE